jgi:hypothetical protein
MPVSLLYQQVEDGVLLSISVIWEITIDGKKVYSINSSTCKAYFDDTTFKLTWILCRDKPKKSRWDNSLVGEGTFIKL